MACVALISLMRTLELEFLEPHPRVVLRKTKEIKSLLEKLAVLQSLLEQSEEKLGVSQAAGMEHLTAKVRDIAFKAEEDIESQVIEIVCAEKKSNLLLAKLLYDMFQCVAEIVCAREKTSPYARLYDMFQSVADEIEECIKKLELDTPLTVRENINLAGSPDRRHTLELEPDEEDLIMVGRAKELTQIREMLLQRSSSSYQEQRQVMSVVGMGGIGKTTFATSIYNDPSIQNHFDLLGWTTVSKDHSLRKVLCDLCRSVMQMPEDEILMASDADLAKRLRQRLIGHRYLIVVDDIWSTKAWDDVQRCFPEDLNGSRILLTTRLKEVVDYTGSSGKYVLNLPFLNSDESWKLFYEKVCSEEEERLPLELEEVGKRIVRKCNGLPLALVVVAGLLSKTNKSLEKWESIASMIINLQVTSDFHEQCSNILTFSYNNLPYPLKACFLYFGVFPEDSEILIKDLIRLWIAEGFIKVDSSQRNLEELVAKDYLQDLIDRNLVLICKQSWGGNMKTCRIHDLLYDLCLRETKNHMLVSTIQSDCSLSANSGRCFKMLRVLDLRSIAFNYVPQFDITDLILLRYLGLDSIKFIKVIEHRSNLQTLIVNRGRSRNMDDAASEWLLGIWKSQKLSAQQNSFGGLQMLKAWGFVVGLMIGSASVSSGGIIFII
ncbi:putative late blight resistance protein homolog R1A-10 [Ipomoea triloba]|uniref:putative late blight resistance protein homolog R1A-10 n=1 Tax=Ipomoea triloba TaxID=35885 RepID=UPI00125E5AC4|nr:putative late blight resistance protein homolog R1A-10 [Ipomoea triloba]